MSYSKRGVAFTEEQRRRLIDQVKLEELPFTLILEPYRRRKTVSQNNLWHGLLRQLANHTGHSMEEMKRYMEEEFGPVIEVNGRMVTKSSAEYTREELSEMIDRTYQVGAQAGAQLFEVA